jgi:hypothetical protein
MRWALRAAAAAPGSVARPEPGGVLRIGRLDRRTLPEQWLAKCTKKEKGTNSVLGTSKSILLRRWTESANTAYSISQRRQSSGARSFVVLARSPTVRGAKYRNASGHVVGLNCARFPGRPFLRRGASLTVLFSPAVPARMGVKGTYIMSSDCMQESKGQAALTAPPLMNARMSALITSA